MPRTYLGQLAVAPRRDLKRLFDDHSPYVDKALQGTLENVFTLPPVAERTDPRADDLGLDVIVFEFQGGAAEEIMLGWFSVPLCWRPKVSVAARLYRLDSGKTTVVVEQTVRVTWSTYFRRLLEPHVWSGAKPLFTISEQCALLERACLAALDRLRRYAM